MDANAVWLGLEVKSWLALSVVGALVAAVGSILGIVIKDFFFSRSLERFKQRQSLDSLVQKFRDPLVLAAKDMISRLTEVLDHYPTVYLKEQVFLSRPERQEKNSIHDPYFQRYKLISTLYRLSALLGWLELYRQELTFLHPGDSVRSNLLEAKLHLVRGDLADGQLNTAEDWDEWKDTLVFREELRAIGESMIETRGQARSIVGYGKYCDLLDGDVPNPTNRWGKVLLNFLLDLDASKDFRRIRLQRLLSHLIDLLTLLDPGAVEAHMRRAAEKHSDWKKVAASQVSRAK